MSAPHVLIAGAGIGGLTAAIALARRGFAVTIVEKRTGFGETGAGIQISPNAGHVLDALDLRLQLRRVSVTADRLVVRRWRDGEPLTRMPMSEHQPEAPFRLLRRADLHLLLLDAARSLPGIRLVIGRALAQVETTPTGIVATLTSASKPAETVAADLLVGADGLWSRVRELTRDAARPVFTGYEAWRALVPAPSDGSSDGPSDAPREVTLHLGRKHHAVHYPVAAGRETNLVIVRAATQPREGWSQAGDASQLAATMTRANPALRALAAAAPGWQVWSLFDRTPAAMAQGRIAVLGDAAHPILPFMAQGAALAIEDAAVLAQALASHWQAGGNASVPAALAAYAAARMARVARVQETSRGNGRAYHLGAPLSLARDLVMRRLGPDGMRRRQDWIYGWRAGV